MRSTPLANYGNSQLRFHGVVYLSVKDRRRKRRRRERNTHNTQIYSHAYPHTHTNTHKDGEKPQRERERRNWERERERQTDRQKDRAVISMPKNTEIESLRDKVKERLFFKFIGEGKFLVTATTSSYNVTNNTFSNIYEWMSWTPPPLCTKELKRLFKLFLTKTNRISFPLDIIFIV